MLRYDHLVVRDGAGRELEARMAVRMEGGEAEALLEVDDRDAVWPVTIDPIFTQQQQLEASDAGPGQQLGTLVAISGETVVVGGGQFQTSVYVFVRSGGVWNQQQKLEVQSWPTSVAISGETIVVGWPYGGSMNQGSAYVFVRSGGVWSQQQKLEASDAPVGGQLGTSVAISGDTIVASAPYGGSMSQGSVYVFVRSGGVWSQQQKLEVQFGTSVAISGETFVVGALYGGSMNQGWAYVFVRSGGVWSQQQKLEASDAPVGGQLGTSVAISGDTIVASAPYGGSMSQGSAYVFVRSGGVWNQQQKLEASDAPVGGQLGTSVAISGDTIVAGASQGGAYVFVRSGGVWSQQQKLEVQFGTSVAISGETVVIGAPYSGSMLQGLAYVFVAVADTPPTITLKAPISLWPPDHNYRAVILSQMVQSASDAEDGNLINSVVVEKVTSDEPDNAPGGSDGNTSNDIVIAGDCKSVRLRSERDETKNGRVYSVTLRVADSAGNVTRAVFRVSVRLNQSGAPAVEDMPPVLTVTSSCH